MATQKELIEPDSYHISLPDSEQWALTDLYRFPHAFEQCYSFVYCLDSELPARDRERIDTAFESYPWRGGYSYVNIYTVLHHQVPHAARPRITSIHKASPGWLDLALNLDAAVTLAKSVAILAGSAAGAAAAYAKAVKILSNINAERERARLRELQLRREQIKALNGSCTELAKALGFKSVADLHRRTGNPEVSLKLLAAHYRKMKVLLEYVEENKVVLPTEIDG